jgi:hypothetical protein
VDVAASLRRGRAYARRFGLLYAALIVVGGVALGGAVAVATRPAPPKPAPWSTWQPTGHNEADIVRQIAAHAAKAYTLPNGRPLTVVRGVMPLSFGSVAPELVLHDPTSVAAQQGFALLPGRTAEFEVCGTDKKGDCAIPASRVPPGFSGPLTRRQALDIAVTTLKYAPNVENVVVIMPNVIPHQKVRVLVLRRQDARTFLDHPLSSILPGKSTRLSALDAEQIAIRTDRFLFHYRVAGPTQSGQYAFVIDPVSNDTPTTSTTTSSKSS